MVLFRISNHHCTKLLTKFAFFLEILTQFINKIWILLKKGMSNWNGFKLIDGQVLSNEDGDEGRVIKARVAPDFCLRLQIHYIGTPLADNDTPFNLDFRPSNAWVHFLLPPDQKARSDLPPSLFLIIIKQNKNKFIN